MDKYFCKLCNLNYKSRTGLWKHNNKYHSNIENDNNESDNNENNSNICKYCEKKLCDRFSKWKHEKKCTKHIHQEQINKVKEEFNDKIQKLESQIEVIKNKPSNITNIKNINNGTINKGPVYSFLRKPGDENINILSEKEIEHIMDQEMNCIIGLVEILNFNEKYPENHSFCTTALNDKYISAINSETLMIEKFRKTDFYDKILNNGLRNMKLLYDKLRSKKSTKAKRYKETIDKLTEFLVLNNKGKKTYVELINSLTFNRRHIAQSTWFQLQQGIIPVHKTDTQIPDVINDINKKEVKTKKPIISCPSSDCSDSDDNTDIDDNTESDDKSEISESDDSISEELPEIKIQGKTYLLDDNKLYQNNNGHKGEYIGELMNGKIKKHKHFDV